MKQEMMMERPSGKTKRIIDAAEKHVPEFGDGSDWYKKLDAAYAVTTREKKTIDRHIFKIVKTIEEINEYFPNVKIPAGTKTHEINVATELQPPIFSEDFLTEDLDEAKKEAKTFYPIFFSKGFRLNKIDIDATRNNRVFDIDHKALNVRAAATTMSIYRQKIMWRGFDITGYGEDSSNDQGKINSNSEGILNTTNVQTIDVGTGDSDITAAGDGVESLSQAMSSLIPEHFGGPYYMFMSPQVYITLLGNKNSTTHETDIERLQTMVDPEGNKLLRKMKFSYYLLNGDETSSSNSEMAFIDPRTPSGEPTILIGDEYPITHYPFVNNPMAIRGKVIYGGCPMVIRPKAVAHDPDVVYS